MWYAKKQVAGTADENLPILSAAAPFKAGTRGDASYYTDIPAGPLAIKNVVDLYLYDNVTALLKVTGAQIKEWLECLQDSSIKLTLTAKTPHFINSSYPS
ncbi:2',3'-cyclic-nucleotide 2'-phosphodiesterase [Streptococcus thermophilus CNCM I-1630]|nr:2',3'-cyclic-nucleotide 2'-phosphodiesterase [Streptococcus thermophilus CNCM I-1630]